MTHAQRFIALTALLRNEQRRDPYYIAACYVLTFHKALAQAAEHVVSHHGIDFPALQRHTKSSSDEERLVIDIIYNLFNTNTKCAATPFQIASLDLPWLELVLNAMLIVKEQLTLTVEADSFVFSFDKYKSTVRMYDFLGGKLPQTSLWPR